MKPVIFVRSLVLLLWWSSTATTAQTNAVSVSKSCYNPGESFVVSFTDANPQVRDWIGILKASDDVNGASVRYLQYVYTCGTLNCNSGAPGMGMVSIVNNLAAGQYKAVLLRSGKFQALAQSASFTVAAKVCGGVVPPSIPTRPPTSAPVRPTAPVARSSISVARSCYRPRNLVVLSFVDVGPQTGDIVGLVNATADINASGKYIPAYIYTCGSYTCKAAPTTGNVSLYQNFAPGQYKALLLRGKQLKTLAVSNNFTIASVCPGPPFTPTPGHSVSVSKSCYAIGENVITNFTDSDAQSGDRIGLTQASSDVEGFPISYPSIIYTCGTRFCTGAPKSGTVSVFQRFAKGPYKAVLLRGNLQPLAVSANFNVSSTCS